MTSLVFRSPFLSRPVIISPLSNTKYRQLKINQNRSQILDKRLSWNHFLDLANALKCRRSKLTPAKKWTPLIEEIDPVFPVGDENILSPEKCTWNFQVQRLNKRSAEEMISLTGFLLPRSSEFLLCRIQVGNPSRCSKFSYWAPKSTVTYGTAWVKVL